MKQFLKDMGITALAVGASAGLIIGASVVSGRFKSTAGTPDTGISTQMADGFDETIERMRNDPGFLAILDEYEHDPELPDKIGEYFGSKAKHSSKPSSSYDTDAGISTQMADGFDETIERMRNDPGFLAILDEYEHDPELPDKIREYFGEKAARSKQQ